MYVYILAMSLYKIYTVEKYANWYNSKNNEDFKSKKTQKYIDKDYIEMDYKSLIKELKNDKFYHFRIHKNTQYIFFGDLDHYKDSIEEFKKN